LHYRVCARFCPLRSIGRRLCRGAESIGDFDRTSSRLAVPRFPRANGLSRSFNPVTLPFALAFPAARPALPAIEVALFFISALKSVDCPCRYFFERPFLAVAVFLLRGMAAFFAAVEPLELFEPFARIETAELFLAPPRARPLTFIPFDRLLIRFGISSRCSAAPPIIVPTAPPITAPIGPATAAPSIAPVAPPATFLRTCNFGSVFPVKELFLISIEPLCSDFKAFRKITASAAPTSCALGCS
jgi:hypothetical protein